MKDTLQRLITRAVSRATRRAGLCWLSLLLPGLARGGTGTDPQAFVLREYLGHNWSNEVVVFQLDANAITGQNAPHRLLGPDGSAVPFQIVPGTNGLSAIAFQTDLPEFSERTYRLAGAGGANPPATDLHVEEEPSCIRITNSLVGLEIPTARGAWTNGPFLRMKLRSGTWIGASRLVCKTPIESYTTRVTASGPVYAEVECLYRFADGKPWQITYRVEAREPVVLVSETCDLADGTLWEVLLNPGFSPSQVFSSTLLSSKETSNYHFNRLSYNNSAPLALAPWPVWWVPSSVGFLGLFNLPEGNALLRGSRELVALPTAGEAAEKVNLAVPAGADDGASVLEAFEKEGKKAPTTLRPIDDFLGVAAGQAEFWANPGDDGQSRSLPLCTRTNGDLFLACYLFKPGRRWLLAALTTKDNLVASETMSTAQKMMVKHLETPLNEVVHMVLDWDSKTALDYPRLVTPRRELAARPEVQASAPARRALKQNNPPGALSHKLLYPALKIFLGSPDQPAQSVDTVHRCERIIRMATYTDMLLGSDVLTRPELSSVLGLHAVEWGRPVLTDKDVFSEPDIRYARAQIAFLAYKLSSPNYYSLERNYRANPNMTSTRYGAMAILACLVPDHPQAKEWAQGGLNEVERELREWTGPNGGWIESPHYQTTAMASILLLSLGARNAGFKDYLDDPRLWGAMRYLARISTPPDVRFGKKRHFPPAGNTYQNETTGLFAVLAKACRQTHRDLSDELQWTWIQQGRPRDSGIGGPFYANALQGDFEPAGPPKWASESFPGSGAVLRNGFPGERETYLYLLQGGFAEHYDYDRGSFELWGKGRPLCLDWGYSFKAGRMPPWQHNRVDIGNWGAIKAFQASEAADYLHSVQEAWERQVFLVKDPDPLGANYFVMRDTIAQPAANWWLWLYTEQSLQRSNDVVHVTGIHDVDLDIWLAPKLSRHLKPAEMKVREKKQDIAVPLADSLGDVGQAVEGAALASLNEIGKAPAATQTRLPGNGIETRTVTSECFDMNTQLQVPLTQEGLTLPVTQDEPVFCVLYPRLKGEKAAVFASLADGRGVRVSHAAGTDYIFLSTTPFEFHEGDVSFKGRAGVIRVRGTTLDLALGDSGEIAKGGKQLAK